jgi:hypothetical protein
MIIKKVTKQLKCHKMSTYEILAPIVRLYAGAIGDDFILMDDNARPHRARIVNEYLQQETIERMDWQAKSLALNPIEHASTIAYGTQRRSKTITLNFQIFGKVP